MEVWLAADGPDRWRWGVDDEQHGVIARRPEGGIEAVEPTDTLGGVRPSFEITAMLMARQGIERHQVGVTGPAVPVDRQAPVEHRPAPPSPTLAERAKRGRQGRL